MDLKNALTVCLISLFSATLVVLIARSLDSQAAARLEPQLARIADELEAIRSSGGITTAASAGPTEALLRDGLVVYYFHSNKRCPTCRAIESQSHETVQAEFAAELGRGEMAWKTLNFEQPAGSGLATQFEIQMPVVVLAQMKDGQVASWKRLEEVWGLVGDKPAFATYVRDEIRRMLATAVPEPVAGPPDDLSEIPVPTDEVPEVPPLTEPAKATPKE
ncbi:MAG: nitrophenyl compound nitroreductase subunit ArsF family protein [Pirellulaceae bacterium]